jgi:ATP-dependent exoDNAse (exonuclease V) alpha subunit
MIPAELNFATGDRVQFTAPYREEHLANRQLGTVEQIDAEGNLQIRLDSGQDVRFNIREHPHLEYGYAVTSHSSQGATADRVLVHVDTEQAHDQLVSSRLAYVSVSRGRFDAQIYTNGPGRRAEELRGKVSSGVRRPWVFGGSARWLVCGTSGFRSYAAVAREEVPDGGG